MQYRSDVDGLRAVAVLSVLFFHSGLPAFSGGYVGVDVFFVISGYLIVGQLIEDIDRDSYSIARFYERRIRRIMPALVFTIFLSFIASSILFLPNALFDFYRSLTATTVFVSNIYFWRNSGYFETAALDRPLLHTWSLSVEEQFYIIIPLALFVTFKWFRPAAFPVFLGAALLSFFLSVFLTDRGPTANFFLLPTRAWELLVGALIVLLRLPPIPQVYREGLAALGLIFIALAVTTFSSATAFPGLTALLPTVGAALVIIGTAEKRTFVSRALSWRPAVAIGLLSYSLYLVHWPIIVFVRYIFLRDLRLREILAVVCASGVLAYLSWRFVETPFRRRSPNQRIGHVFHIAALTLVALAAVGLGGGSWTQSQLHASAADVASEDVWLSKRCFLIDQDASAWRGDLCVRTSGAPRNALLWGDSFAAHYIPGLIRNQKQLTHNVVQYTFAGCPPVLSYQSYARPGCHSFNARVFEIISRYNVDAVIMSSRWDLVRQRGVTEVGDTIRQLVAVGVKVYVIGQSPLFPFSIDVLLSRAAGQSENGESSWYLSFERSENSQLNAVTGTANFIDPLRTFCDDRLCKYQAQHQLLFYDYGHLSNIGSDMAVRSYFPLYRAPASAESHIDTVL